MNTANRRQRKPRGEPRGCCGLARACGAWTLTLPFLVWAGAHAAEPLGSTNDLPALLPPRAELPPGFWESYGGWVVFGGVFALVFAAGALWLWLLTRRRPPVIPAPAVEARRALEPLEHHPETGAVLSCVSQVLRHYFSAAFFLPPGELTTAEFCRALPQRVAPEVSREVTEFLQECDRRKFAPASPDKPLGAVATASKLIEQAEASRDAIAAAPPPTPALPPTLARDGSHPSQP